MGGQSRGWFGCDPGIESSRVVGRACGCLPGEDADGSGGARVASAVRNKPTILVGMPEKMVNNEDGIYAHLGYRGGLIVSVAGG